MTVGVAVLGSGNIGTDLLIKLLRRKPQVLEPVAMVGIDPASDGLARAERLGVATTSRGLDGLLALPEWDRVRVLFDATSAGAHAKHAAVAKQHGRAMVDLTPAAVGPYTVPVVNLDAVLGALGEGEAPNLNLVTCGGQATIPMVHAVARVAPVHYAEIVASIASRSAGPGTRANIDEFTVTTSRGLERVGGAASGKAIIVLNPAEPPLVMRDTVFTLSDPADTAAIADSVERMVEQVRGYVPGYRLKQDVQFTPVTADAPVHLPGRGTFTEGLVSQIFLEVEGAAHYLPAYAGNLDIMTSAALATGERLVGTLGWSGG